MTPDQVVRILRSSLSATGKVLVSFSKLSGRKLIRPLLHQNGVLHSLSDTQLSARNFSKQSILNSDSPRMLPQYVNVHKSNQITDDCNVSTSKFFTEDDGSVDDQHSEPDKISYTSDKIENRRNENQRMNEKDSIHFSPQKIFQYFNRHDSILNSRRLEFPDDYFHLSKPKSLYAEDFKVTFL